MKTKTISSDKGLAMRILLGGGYLFVTLALLLIGTEVVLAASLGDVAETVTESMTNVTKLITAASYVAGMGFALSGIIKFKAHKDNPTQVPLSAPIVLVVIAAALLFLPSVLKVAGGTLFGEEGTAGTAEGFAGGFGQTVSE